MAHKYREVDRDQVFLVPPSLRDWLPGDHLVWFVIDAVEQLDVSALRAKSRLGGPGRQGFDPAMMLTLWAFASARGIASSRQLERACLEDVAFRVIAAGATPDHSVLAAFRQQHRDAMEDLFTQVLGICVRAGMGDFGRVAIDGTKVKANASAARTVSLQRLRRIAAAELDRADATDAAEDAADAPGVHDEVPPRFRGTDRKARIAQALRELEEQVEAETGQDVKDAEQRVTATTEKLQHAQAEAAARGAEFDAAAAAGAPRRGLRPGPAPKPVHRAQRSVDHAETLLQAARDKHARQTAGEPVRRARMAQRNTTDPDSRIMKTRTGYQQAYNAQLAVADDGLIVVAEATNNPTDCGQLEDLVDRAVTATVTACTTAGRSDRIGTVVADNGYLTDSVLDITTVDVLVAPGGRTRDGVWTPGQTRARHAATVMHDRLQHPEAKTTYARRAAVVEPRNADLKDRRGLRQLACRGLTAARAEVHLAALVTNLLRLRNRGLALTT